MAFIDQLLGLIAPSTCLVCGTEGSLLCGACTPVNLRSFGARCYRCNRLSAGSRTCTKCARLGGPRHMWISVVYDGPSEQLVERFKYKSARNAAQIMAGIMAQKLVEQNLPTSTLIVPIPTATSRIRERGFDHTSLLAKSLATRLNMEFDQALTRLGQTQQVGARRTQRLRQVEFSYMVKRPATLRGRNVLLVDDVLTTGATMQVCAKLLRKAGAKRVDGIVFAKKQ